jgi:DNA-binding NarL/FixJ family response regulator
MKQVRVLLIEDHFLACIALQSVFAGHAQILVVGEAHDGEKGIELFRSLLSDVVVLDLRLPRISGFDVITTLRKERHPARIVVLSNYHGSEDIHRAVLAGARAYLTKDASGEELINAIQSVHRDPEISASGCLGPSRGAYVHRGAKAPRERSACLHCARPIELGDC